MTPWFPFFVFARCGGHGIPPYAASRAVRYAQANAAGGSVTYTSVCHGVTGQRGWIRRVSS